MKRVMVCGDREWSDEGLVFRILDRLCPDPGEVVIIEGESRGADRMGRAWADARGAMLRAFPADWRRYGRAAGPVRNQQMIDEGQPELVVAFHDDLPRSNGTKDIVKRAAGAGVEVRLVCHLEN